MKYILVLLLLFCVNTIVTGQTFSDDNFIYTVSPKKAVKPANLNTLTKEEMNQNISYFDGLGRPIQTRVIGQGGKGEDIITPVQYDEFGRQLRDYLPYTSSNGGSSYPKVDPAEAINASILHYSTEKYDNTSNPFSEKKLEPAPLHKVLKQGAPGTSWAMGEGHELKFDYQTNTSSDTVKLFKANTTWNAGSGLYDISFTDEGNYEKNQLYKTITYDENSVASPTESFGSTVEFKNKEGRVVLKRTYESGDKHDTYYVYDIYGNLTYVLPPLVNNPVTQMNDLCYQYKYDNRNRLVEKKLPGKQSEFIVYDKLDRPVATGPAFSPFSDSPEGVVGWMITKYDVYNRPVYTGWEQSTTVSSAGRTAKQITMSGLTTISESKQTTTKTIGNIAGIAYYSNSVLPTTFELLTLNYYDDYVFQDFTPAIVYTAPVAYNNSTLKPKGLATGSWTRVLTTLASPIGESGYILYDDKARPVKNYLQNYLGGYTSSESKLDFTGKTLYTFLKHKRTSGTAEIVVREDFTYSAQDRLLTHTHQIDGRAVELMADNTYDALGQLESKKVGNNIGNPLQKIDYEYNVRGWLTEINKISDLQHDTDPVDLFAFKINYDTTQTYVAGVSALYNGNISETFWKTASDLAERAYGYKYDNLNRLKNAVYEKNSVTTGAYDENLTYDKNGNIKTLSRNGDDDPQVGNLGIDDLAYTYLANSNQLIKVVDNSNSPSGFTDANTTDDDYSYDANGNMFTDKNKNITAISYNHLNLPKKITFGTTGSITYFYTAAGQKIEKIVTQGNITTTTNYLGGYQYKDNVLEFFPTAEGYVNNSTGGLSYVFQYKDHLGNVRVSYAKNPTTQVLDIIDETHYYPFGLKHSGYVTMQGSNNKYKYNGKELQDESIGGFQLNLYDYGARNYDPALGRWINLDALSEEYSDYSPYVYAFNDPIRHIDPDGNAPEDRLGEIDPPGKKKTNQSTIATLNREPRMQGGYVGQGLDEIVTAGIQWLGGQISGSDVSKETSENFQLATSLLVVVVSKGKNAKADGEVVEQLTKTEASAAKSGTGRGSNNRTADPDAVGDHTVINERGSTTYKTNPSNPNKNSKGVSFETQKRVDYKGAAHVDKKTGVKTPTPHVQEKGNVRPAIPGVDMPKKIK